MKTQFKLTVCSLLALAIAAPVSAADLGRRAPAPAYKAPPPAYVPFSWTGLYGGLVGGYGWGNSTWSNAAGSSSFRTSGGMFGPTLGYNFQTGAFVWGLEGDIMASWNRGSSGVSAFAGCATGCQTWNTGLGTVRGRIGYAWDRWMIYGTGGLAVGSIRMTPAGGGSDVQTKAGWTAGGGVEYAFATPWSLKLEYLYADLGNASCSIGTCGLPTNVSFRTSMVRAGLNYHF